MEERGLGIRYIQYSLLLSKVGNEPEAFKYFKKGQEISIKYSDYKTITFSSIVEAELYKKHDLQRALNSLRNGQRVAKKYSLLLRESKINLQLAELSFERNDTDISQLELFERNQEIFTIFVNIVKQCLKTLSSKSHLEVEFRLFSEKTRENFRNTLFLDYEHTVRIQAKGLTEEKKGVD